MGYEDKKQAETFSGDGFAPAENSGVGDWGASDGYSLWDAAGQDTVTGFEDWEGRQETRDMFHSSYE
ncbi:hypothetical protein [Paenibacillus typhae]|uniref:hypothetical protein n=1 Tax=Paenibacillus typhae TaxID=1174501 RepID=UPI001C8EE83C|nr:hypothetical protein [Paenibacillus typhae]MBY0014556.1 hypothetical protein [Paenibacillus typhae]